MKYKQALAYELFMFALLTGVTYLFFGNMIKSLTLNITVTIFKSLVLYVWGTKLKW